MFISTLELFKIGIGPSSSHTMGPMFAALEFRRSVAKFLSAPFAAGSDFCLRSTLRGSLAHTGKGHCSDRGIVFGLNGYEPRDLVALDTDALFEELRSLPYVDIDGKKLNFNADTDIIFDLGPALRQHPNGMVFSLFGGNQYSDTASPIAEETYFSIGGGFICNIHDFEEECIELPLKNVPYPFASAKTMLKMALDHDISIADMKRQNELHKMSESELNDSLDEIWQAMKTCVENGLDAHEELLPGTLKVRRRARELHRLCLEGDDSNINDWLCAYAIAVNEENAAGNMVVTAPTNGAAGVIPAVLYYCYKHRGATVDQIRDYLLTAAAVGGIIKHCSSISGAEVGCQGEVGSAASMAAAGLCAIFGGSPTQIENAAEITNRPGDGGGD